MCKFCYPLVIVPLGVDVQVEICNYTYLEHSDKKLSGNNQQNRNHSLSILWTGTTLNLMELMKFETNSSAQSWVCGEN